MSQLLSPSCKHFPKFENPKKNLGGPLQLQLQLLSNFQLQSQLKIAVKIWKRSKILGGIATILLKNTTARESNKIGKIKI